MIPMLLNITNASGFIGKEEANHFSEVNHDITNQLCKCIIVIHPSGVEKTHYLVVVFLVVTIHSIQLSYLIET